MGFSAKCTQLFIQLALLAGQALRHAHPDAQVEIAVMRAAECRQAFSFHPQYGVRLGAGRHGHADRAVEGRHVQRCAKHGIGERDGFQPEQVRAGTLEARVAPGIHDHEQIPIDTACFWTGHTLAGNAQRHPFIGALRYFYSQRFFQRHFAPSLALRAGMLDGTALPVAIGADGDLLDQDVFLVVPPAACQATGAIAGFALEWRSASLGAGAVAGGTACRAIEADFFLAPRGDPLQRNEYFHLDVLSPPRAGAALAEEPFEGASAAKIEIESAENILEIDAAEQVLPAESGHSGKAAAVVFAAFRRVGENGIGFGDFLETLLGARLLVAVGVIFQGEAAEGVLDRLLVGVLGDAKDLVVITLGGFSNNGAPGAVSGKW